MKNELLSLPGYRMCEYQLVVLPHEDLSNRIMAEKKDFAQRYQAPAAGWGKPQITIARFSQLQLMEERLRSRMETIAMALPAFKIELKDYGSFPSHTIFINVNSTAPFQMIARHLKTAQALLKNNEKKPHFMENFFVMVATKLLPWQYEKGWLQYSNKHFSGMFIAKSMVLLKRPAGIRSFHPIERFEFMNMPVLTTQGALF